MCLLKMHNLNIAPSLNAKTFEKLRGTKIHYISLIYYYNFSPNIFLKVKKLHVNVYDDKIKTCIGPMKAVLVSILLY